jgi:hypothetical protein
VSRFLESCGGLLHCTRNSPPSRELTFGSDMSTLHRFRWFLLGFTVVFVGLAVFRRTGFIFRETVNYVPLWRYYGLEIDRARHSTGDIGPYSEAGTVALGIFFVHMFVSLAGGGALHFMIARGKPRKTPAK